MGGGGHYGTMVLWYYGFRCLDENCRARNTNTCKHIFNNASAEALVSFSFIFSFPLFFFGN